MTKRVRLERNDLPSDKPIPAGKYNASIREAEFKTNRKNTGTVLYLKYRIEDDPFRNRTVPDWLNVEHENETAQEIGRKDLRQLMEACDIQVTDDGAEFVGHQVTLDVGVEKEDPKFAPRNRVYRVSPVGAQRSAPTADIPF